MTNRSFCNKCHDLVPSWPEEREGKVYLVKDCPRCGRHEQYLSADAERYFIKRQLDPGFEAHGCAVACEGCQLHRPPTTAFVDVTNRCNLNCPMCVDGVQWHGFEFDPPMEYFDRILRHLATLDPVPLVAFFGGEPTVRDDLPEIIQLARSYGLKTRVLTNGLRLADPDYCRRLVETRTHLVISYDGSRPECYKELRGSAKVLEMKQRAIENLKRLGRARVSYIACLAWGLNHKDVPELLEFCHAQRHILHGIYLMPLVQTWTLEEFSFAPERMTTEDVERLVAECFPGDDIKFVSLGFASEFHTVARYLGRKAMASYGAHPNCESLYVLISDGERYVPVDRFLKTSLPAFAGELLALEKRLTEREARWKKSALGRTLGPPLLRVAGLAAIWRLVRRHVAFSRMLKGKGLGKLGHALAAFLQTPFVHSARIRQRHTVVHDILRIIILPLEDDPILETDRLERCPSAHVYFDPSDGQFHYVPVCSWRLHNKAILKGLVEHYPRSEATCALPNVPIRSGG